MREESEIHGQTALSTIQNAPLTYLVTKMTNEEFGMLDDSRADSLEAAIASAIADLAAEGVSEPTCYLMPSAAYTVPFTASEAEARTASSF